MVTYPPVSIPPVQSEVLIAGKPYPACIRPEHNGQYLALGSFRPEEDALIYSRVGPYMQIGIGDTDFVAALARGDFTMPSPNTDHPRWFGEFWMYGGLAATEVPDERRTFQSLRIISKRHRVGTYITLAALLGPRRDRGSWPEQISLEISLVVPDSEIDRFILGAEANALFRSTCVR